MVSSSGKKIQISSSFDVDSESLHEKATDHNTGETKVTDKEEPHHTSRSTTITSNPVRYETKGIDDTKVTEGEAIAVRDLADEGYDTSAL